VDVSGYTTLAERLDSEEVKDLIGHLLRGIAKVVLRYEGFVEKFIGDAIMALFEVPRSHEDDPIRAVRPAREIHQLVGAISPKVQKRIAQPLALHVGINTGLVVTGGPDLEEGTDGVAAARVILGGIHPSRSSKSTTRTILAGSSALSDVSFFLNPPPLVDLSASGGGPGEVRPNQRYLRSPPLSQIPR
jgi:hypothetical protein